MTSFVNPKPIPAPAPPGAAAPPGAPAPPDTANQATSPPHNVTGGPVTPLPQESKTQIPDESSHSSTGSPDGNSTNHVYVTTDQSASPTTTPVGLGPGYSTPSVGVSETRPITLNPPTSSTGSTSKSANPSTESGNPTPALTETTATPTQHSGPADTTTTSDASGYTTNNAGTETTTKEVTTTHVKETEDPDMMEIVYFNVTETG